MIESYCGDWHCVGGSGREDTWVRRHIVGLIL
jgi:hypothetical protein